MTVLQESLTILQNCPHRRSALLYPTARLVTIVSTGPTSVMSPPLQRPQIRCREIREGDFAGVAELLSKSFGSQQCQLLRLRRLAEREVPAGLPKVGYLLESAGTVVGAVLMISSAISRNGAAFIRCNLSSWYVEPEFRGTAPLLIARALKHKNVTYVNVTARPNTWSIVEAQGFSRYSKGVFVAVPALNRCREPARVALFDAEARDGLDAVECALLSDHASFGCFSIVCRTPEGAYPFVFARRHLKGMIPGVQLVYCRSIEEFVRYAGRIGRFLAARGVLCVLIDANGAIDGLKGRYFGGMMPKFARGRDGVRQGDLAYTNIAVFGDLW